MRRRAYCAAADQATRRRARAFANNAGELEAMAIASDETGQSVSRRGQLLRTFQYIVQRGAHYVDSIAAAFAHALSSLHAHTNARNNSVLCSKSRSSISCAALGDDTSLNRCLCTYTVVTMYTATHTLSNALSTVRISLLSIYICQLLASPAIAQST